MPRLLGACIARPKKTLAQMKGILKVRKKLPLPTVISNDHCRNRSDNPFAAVITDAETRHKYAINDFPLIPKYAVLDPKVTLSLPPSITATTGMDALTHAVEAYIGRSTTDHTRRDALHAVQLIFENIETSIARTDSLLCHASFMAAHLPTHVGYVHVMSHSLVVNTMFLSGRQCSQ